MISDNERRDVAQRLRESAGNGEVLRDVFLEEILAGDTGLWFAEDIEIDTLLYHLADLIEPTRNCSEPTRTCGECDRDALLALADELEEDACWEVQTPGNASVALRLKDTCDRIREALGIDR